MGLSAATSRAAVMAGAAMLSIAAVCGAAATTRDLMMTVGVAAACILGLAALAVSPRSSPPAAAPTESIVEAPGAAEPQAGTTATVRSRFVDGGGYIEVGGLLLWASADENGAAHDAGDRVEVVHVHGQGMAVECVVRTPRAAVSAEQAGERRS